jgi:hypothetical protein
VLRGDTLLSDLPFDFEVPITFFEKSDAEPGKQCRIGGVITTENPDRQAEVILQRGLSFDDFLTYGWYNDNHDKSAEGILGYPEAVQFFQKGAVLPNGQTMPADGHWAEGYLLDTKKAKKIWELGKALQRTNRRLGFSVEGSIQKRTGPLRKTIAKAKVKNVAITHVPVNGDTKLELLAKSLTAVEQSDPSELEKTLGMGTPAVPGGSPTGEGPKTGADAGQVLARQSLESEQRLLFGNKKDDDEEEENKVKKALTDNEAVVWLLQKRPNLTPEICKRIVTLTKALKRQGRI